MSKWELPKEPQFYKWESPITEIFKQAEENYHKQLNDKLEEQLMCEVNYQVGYAVDKEELIKALQYDRNQYDKGYKDGARETFIEELEKIKDEILNLDFTGWADKPKLDREKVLTILDKYISESSGDNKQIRCNSCQNNTDELSGECYECVKGIEDWYEPISELKGETE